MGKKKMSLKIDVKKAEYKEPLPDVKPTADVKGECNISPTLVMNKVYDGNPRIYLSS